MNLILMLLFIKSVASSLILFFSFIARLYKSLNLKACGVWVNKELFLFKLNICFFILYFIESLDETTGTTALFLFKFFDKFLSNFIEKLGLAASWMNIFFGLYFFRYFNPIKEESDLSLPPLMILTNFGYFFFFKYLIFYLIFYWVSWWNDWNYRFIFFQIFW